jgi:hypothetical protein
MEVSVNTFILIAKRHINQVFLVHRLDRRGLFNVILTTIIPPVVTGEKNSPTVAHACRKRRLKWVLGDWGITGPPSLQGI